MEHCKIVVVGDGAVGKSCLLITSQTGSFPSEYVPTVFDNYAANTVVDGRSYNVGLWDTAGQEDYDRLRPLSYPNTDVFLICFDVANKNSLYNIEQKWAPEVRRYAPDTPVILVANKIDLRENQQNKSDFVTYDEMETFAARLDVSTCLECSALTHKGIDSIIPTAIRMAMEQKRKQPQSRFSFFGKRIFSRKTATQEPQPPVMPPTGLAPWIDVKTSLFADDWRALLGDSSCSDVTFIVGENSCRVHAHKIILAASSFVFKEILLDAKPTNQVPKKYNKLFEEIKWVYECSSNGGLNNLNRNPAVDDGRECVEITMCQTFSLDVFQKILKFLYSGLPGFAEIEDVDFVQEMKKAAQSLWLHWLAEVCGNHLSNEVFLNPSIGTWLNDETGSALKSHFLNSSQLSDVQFRVEGQLVYAHKSVLIARCEVMAAMLGGGFIESRTSAVTEIKDTSLASFLGILEYLYTDHAPIEEGDSIEIMILADRFCLPRLVSLCELYISKKIDKMIQKKVGDAAEYVVNLLILSQAHNAVQLSKWCLHFIASNYSVFEQSPFFSLLRDENKHYVEEHRWPPLSYLQDLQEYETKIGTKSDSCQIM